MLVAIQVTGHFSSYLQAQVLAWAVVAFFCFAVWKWPSVAVSIFLYMAMTIGGWAILAAAPVTIMLARRDNRRRREVPRSFGRAARTLGMALIALIATLPFAQFGSGPWSESNSRQPRRSAKPLFDTTSASGSGDNSLLEKVLRFFRFDPDSQTQGDFGAATPPPPEDPDPFNWLIVVAVVAVLIMLALAYFLWRKRHERDPVTTRPSATPLARLEAVGHMVGRRRRPNEGAIAYATVLAEHTGDRRLTEAGPLVSGQVYESASVNPVAVDHNLSTLEQVPPEQPPKPPLATRVGGWIRSLPITLRGLGYTTVGAAALIGFAWLVVPRLGEVANRGRTQDAVALPSEMPDAWDELLALPTASLERWEVCGFGRSSYASDESSVGLARRSEPHAAFATLNSGAGNQIRTTLGVVRDGQQLEYLRIWMDELVDPLVVPGEWRDAHEQTVPIRTFGSIEAVTGSIGTRDAVRSKMVDRTGHTFTRYESLPLTYDLAGGEYHGEPELGSAITDLVFVIDIWVDEDDVPIRVRVMSGDPVSHWYEWRRTAVPEGQGRLAIPQCPKDQPTPADSGWLGVQRWQQTLSVPPLIGFDPDGHPFDTWSWESIESLEPQTRPVMTLPGPVPSLNMLDAYYLVADPDYYNSSYPRETVVTDWADDADVTIVEYDGYGSAVRIDASDGGPIQGWYDAAGIDLYESSLVLSTADATPTIEADQMTRILEELWSTVDNHTSTDLDGLAGEELHFIQLRNANRIVTGRDLAGNVVAVAIWDDATQWRRLGFEGTPPVDVVLREAELVACVEGTRTIEQDGRCLRSPDS